MAYNDTFPKKLEDSIKRVAKYFTTNTHDIDDLIREGVIAVLEANDGDTDSYYIQRAKFRMVNWLKKEKLKGLTFVPSVRADDGKIDWNKKKSIKWFSLDQLNEEEKLSYERDNDMQ